MSSRKAPRPLTQFNLDDILEKTNVASTALQQTRPRNVKDEIQPTQHVLSKKRTLTPNPDYKKRIRGSPRGLVLVEESQPGQAPGDTFIVRHESPWDTYIKVYECELPASFSMAIRRVRPQRLIAIKTIRGKNVNEMLHLLRRIQHRNILSSQSCFVYDSSIFTLHENIAISLSHIVGCEAYPDEVELASILVQILDGLLYLTDQRLEHPHLSSSSILATEEGAVKVAGLEEWVDLQAAQTPQYSKPLGAITMQLMQKYEKEHEIAGVDDVERWPCDSRATEFLSLIASNIPLKTLRDHHLFTETSWAKGHLIGLVSFALRSSFTFCLYSK
ncbi:hypothetical protein LOZ66_005606 [Ophidiomyces ophidiicola]|nr:hypothetical protein LOZ66_005606 [Ophidiomyces ophidiicola]